MINGIPKTRDPWILYYWFVNELRMQGYDDYFISTVLAKPPYVPRGKCSNCGQAIPPQKVKHKEVLENVMWIRDMTTDFLYPYYGNEPLVFKKFEFKRTKITIEWEE